VKTTGIFLSENNGVFIKSSDLRIKRAASTQEVIMEPLVIVGLLFAVFCGLAGLILGVNNPN
jgi:hypothetical protein